MKQRTSDLLINLGMSIVCSKGAQKILNSAFGINPRHFTMGFVKEADGRWYADIRHWPRLFHSNLEMIAGADDLLEALDKGKGYVRMEVDMDPADKRDFFKMVKVGQTNLGATYKVLYCDRYNKKAWLCNVGKFVMGQHPDAIFARQIE